jgi:GT2 family glycosyltransferase
MFMLFVAADYAALGGFDEDYFLYYEDVDLCVRLWCAGRRIVLCPQAAVLHAAQRASHRNLRHLAWHLGSMARYFIRHWGRLPAAGARR